MTHPRICNPDLNTMLAPLTRVTGRLEFFWYPLYNGRNSNGPDVSVKDDKFAFYLECGSSAPKDFCSPVVTACTNGLAPGGHELAVSMGTRDLFIPSLDMLTSFDTTLALISASFSGKNRDVLVQMLNKWFGGKPKVFNSGNSFHLVSPTLFHENDFGKFCGDAIDTMSSLVDLRWIGHSLQRQAFHLRVSNLTGVKPHPPRRLVEYESRLLLQLGMGVSAQKEAVQDPVTEF